MDFLFARKNTTIAPTTMTETTIPAMAPPPILDFLPPSTELLLLPPTSGVVLPPPDWWCLFLFGMGGVPGGGGGADPELHPLPPLLMLNLSNIRAPQKFMMKI